MLSSTIRTPLIIGKALLAKRCLISCLERRVGVADCDFNRHLTNSMYPRYMDQGRWDLVVRSGAHRVCLSKRVRPVVVDLKIKFRRELKFGTQFILDSRITNLDGKAMVIEQYFLVDGIVHAQAEVRSLILGRRGVISPSDFAPFLCEPWSDATG
jgi:YbgC/YbaW family acyl-CoA thioester hydrolase